MADPVKSNVVPFPRTRDPAEELSDVAIIAACATGDETALRMLYRRHQPAVHRFVSRLLGPGSPSVDDVVHETFLVAWDNADSFRGEGRVSSWLFGIASKKARGYLRKESRRARLFRVFSAPGPDQTPSCEDEVARRQLVQQLGGELDRLPADLKVAFVLCDVEGLSGTEAAASLGIRPGTMWRRLHEARKRLREHLQEVLR